jgi:hypothetical protein
MPGVMTATLRRSRGALLSLVDRLVARSFPAEPGWMTRSARPALANASRRAFPVVGVSAD